MIHRCETCPFWKKDCENYGRCEAEDRDPRFNAEKWDEGSWTPADLYTRRDFGCIIHPMNKAIA